MECHEKFTQLQPGEEKSLILPSHNRLINYRKYIGDHLGTMNMKELDQRIHKQANRYKTRCRTFLDEIQEHSDMYESKSKVPGTQEANCLKMSVELDSVLEVLVQTATELENGNKNFLRILVNNEEKKQNELKTCLARYYETKEMLRKMDAELIRAQATKEWNIRQQKLDIAALGWFIGEQEMNLAKETSYATRSAEAAIARLDNQWKRKINDVKKDIATSREQTISEDKCNNKFTFYLNESLHKTQTKKRDSALSCNAELQELNSKIAELKRKIKRCNNGMLEAEAERQLIREFNSVFESEMLQAKQEANFRMKSKDAAIKIQSVWRGIMVRKGLGPYKHLRKRKRRRGKKGGKKNKKK